MNAIYIENPYKRLDFEVFKYLKIFAPKEICYKMASLGKMKNLKTNRMAEHYR